MQGTSSLACTRQLQSKTGEGLAGLCRQFGCTQLQFLGSARTASSVVVVPTPTDPMGFLKSTRDFKAPSAAKEVSFSLSFFLSFFLSWVLKPQFVAQNPRDCLSCFLSFFLFFFLSFFLSWVLKPQFVAQNPRDCPGPLPASLGADCRRVD